MHTFVPGWLVSALQELYHDSCCYSCALLAIQFVLIYLSFPPTRRATSCLFAADFLTMLDRDQMLHREVLLHD